MLKNRIFYGILLLISLWLYFIAPQRIPTALLLMMAVLPAISFVMLLFARLTAKISYKTDSIRTVRGHTVAITVAVRCGLFLSFCYIHFISSDKDSDKILSLAGTKEVSLNYSKVCPHIGEENYAHEKIKMYDMLGLFCLSAKAQKLFITVYPQKLNVRNIGISGGVTGEVISQNGLQRDNVLVSSVREYQPDDSMRSIHWKLSSKTGKLMTKENEKIETLGLNIVADTKNSAECYDRIIETVMSATRFMIKKNLASRLWVPPTCFEITEYDEYKSALDEVVHLKRDTDKSLDDSLAEFMRSNRPPCSLLIATSEENEQARKSVEVVSRLGYDVYLVKVSKDVGGVVNLSSREKIIPNNGEIEISF